MKILEKLIKINIAKKSKDHYEFNTIVDHAQQSLSSSRYLESYFLFSEAFRLKKDLKTYLMMNECKRLIGLENNINPEILITNVNDYLNCFGFNWAVDHINSILRSKSFNNKKIIQSISKNQELNKNKSVVEQLIYNGVNPKTLKLDILKLELISDLDFSSTSETIIHNEYEDNLPKLEVAFSDRKITQKEFKIKVKKGTIITNGSGFCFEGSEAIVFTTEKKVYVDSLTFDSKEIVNFKNDNLIAGVFNNHVYLYQPKPSKIYYFDQIFWLGTPMSNEWGHWINECLIKLTYFYESNLFINVPVLVSEKVPDSFLKFAQRIFPEINFCKIKKNSKIIFKNIYSAPSRVFGPTNLYWTLDYGPLRINQEPQSSALLNKFIKKIAISKIFPEKVFLDRLNTSNRVSSQIHLVRKIVKGKKYLCLDPGTLKIDEEISLFRYSTSFAGFMGSQLLLGFTSSEISQFSILHHDAPEDFRGFNWTLIPRNTKWFLGLRNIITPGFGDLISHRQHISSEELLQKFEESL